MLSASSSVVLSSIRHFNGSSRYSRPLTVATNLVPSATSLSSMRLWSTYWTTSQPVFPGIPHPETLVQSLTSCAIVIPFETSLNLVNSRIRLISRPESTLLSKREDPLTIQSYQHINKLTPRLARQSILRESRPVRRQARVVCHGIPLPTRMGVHGRTVLSPS